MYKIEITSYKSLNKLYRLQGFLKQNSELYKSVFHGQPSLCLKDKVRKISKQNKTKLIHLTLESGTILISH